jgi:nicotinamide riboside transporter PnuC
MKHSYLTAAKWIAVTVNIIGVTMLDFKLPGLQWSFVLCTVGAGIWIWAGFQMKERGLVIQNLVYGILNIIGIYRWFFT